MKDPVSVKTFLEKSSTLPVIDVRSPAEYDQGHIPGAINIPLFTNEERKEVGTLYKKQGRKEAIMKGFEIAARKSVYLRQRAVESASGKELLVHCWRGGVRSGAMGWLFERAGIRTELLAGGYKAYRRFLRSYLTQPFRLIVLGGMTGSGKTEILHEIASRGHQIVDLEALAHHKGSAFGALGETRQPTTEQFENDLLARLLSIDPAKPVWVEDESRNIGKNIIPAEFFTQMRQSPVISIELERDLRIQRLVSDYGKFMPEDLIACINRITKRIGGQNAKKAIEMTASGNYHEVAAITLNYYDKTYRFGLTKRANHRLHPLRLHSISPGDNATMILNYGKEHNLV